MNGFLRIKTEGTRVYGLDLLRAIAIFSVMWGHCELFLTGKTLAVYSSFHMDGVSIFFVLSGFLIGGILLKILERDKANLASLWNFWTRRWLRTLPAYVFVLSLLALIYSRFSTEFTFDSIKSYYLFLQNFNTPAPGFFNESWSLSIEEWFYLITPAALFMLVGAFRLKPRLSVPIVAGLIIVAVTAYRYYRFVHLMPATLESWDDNFRKLVTTRLDALMYGMIGAYIAFYKKDLWIRYKTPLLFAGICGMILGCYWLAELPMLYVSVFSFSVFSLGTLCTLPYLSEWKTIDANVSKYITHLSIISYSVYLINHTLILQLLIGDLLQHKIYDRFHITGATAVAINYVLYWVATIVLSTLMYKYLEVPFMNLRGKLNLAGFNRLAYRLARRKS